MRSFILLYTGLLLFASCGRIKQDQIDYTVTVIHRDSIHQLQVEMSFKPSHSGTTILEYPNSAWGQEDLYDAIEKIEVKEQVSNIQMNRDSGCIVINHPKNLKILHFKYVLQQDFNNPITSRNTYRPIIQPEYFHLFSHNLFMVPKIEADTLDIKLNWKGLAPGQVVHNSFGSGNKEQSLESIAKTEFLGAIFVGGDFVIDEISVGQNKVHLATRGEWVPFTVGQMKALLKETLLCQRNFWDDHSQTYFSVSMQPIYASNGSSYQGTGLTNSFATSFSNNQFMEIEQMVHLFNHELMHNWIGGIIKNANEEEQYWFSEGFTEYYTFKNIARNGINGLGPEHYIEELNATITKLYSSSVFKAPNSEINYNNFWTNGDYSQLPYYRGAVFAFFVDQEIRRVSNGRASLDDVMKEILLDARTKGQMIDHNYFVGVVSQYLGADFQPFFEKHIEDGVPVPLHEVFKQLGLDFAFESNVYELGFALSTDNTEVESVVEGSAAHRAGLRTGDKLVSRSIWYGNIEKPVKLVVQRGKTVVNFEFYPIKKGQVPQVMESIENLTKLGF